MPQVQVNVLIDEACCRAPAPVLEGLAAAGLEAATLLAGLGVVLGSVDAPRLDALRGVPGVLAVEQSREVRTQGA